MPASSFTRRELATGSAAALAGLCPVIATAQERPRRRGVP